MLLCCVASELDPTIAHRLSIAANGTHAYATFGVALDRLPEPHWSALSTAGPLRRFGLVDVGEGWPLTSSPLRIAAADASNTSRDSIVARRTAAPFRRPGPARPLPASMPPPLMSWERR